MKRFFLLIVIIFASFAVLNNVYADDLEFSNVKFVNEFDLLVQSYPNVGDYMYATVTVKNTSQEEKDVLLVAGCYDDEGIMIDVFISSAVVGAGDTKTISTKVDINEENLKVVANVLTFSDLKRACIKPANMLGNSTDIEYITVNGKKLEGYSNSENTYSVKVNTPTANVKAIAQDSTTEIKIKEIYIPGRIKVDITSQFGSKRTINIDCSTTNPQPRPIRDVNVILRADYNDNTGYNIFDNKAETWFDLSGYGNDIPLVINDNNLWTNSGLYLKGGPENLENKIYLSKPLMNESIVNAINSHDCTIQFELASISAVPGKKCAILSSSNDSFVIYQENDKTDLYLYLKWGGADLTKWRPKITQSQALSGVNTIVIDNTAALMSWYVDGSLITSEPIRSTTSIADDIIFSDFNTGYGGAVTFKNITIYDKALSADEVEVVK